MADFRKALEFVLPHEGGYSNNPADPGGETNYGITAAVARAWGYSGDMASLDIDTAAAIYEANYWPGLELVTSQQVASKILDMRVNFGVGGATRLVQEAVNELVEPPVVVDGGWGPDTLDAVNTADPVELTRKLAEVSAAKYQSLAMAKPGAKQFLGGWLKRAADIPAMAATGGILLLIGIGAIAYLVLGGRAKA